MILKEKGYLSYKNVMQGQRDSTEAKALGLFVTELVLFLALL